MDLDSIRDALGQLQRDAESKAAWKKLGDALESKLGASRRDSLPLLTAARLLHAGRGEWDAVEQLLKLEVRLAETDAAKLSACMELARVRGQEQLDEAGAVAAYKQALEIVPGDELAAAAVSESEERKLNWRSMVSAYAEEAASAPDDVYKASMLMRVAEAEWRFADEQVDVNQVLALLAQAAELDPKNAMVSQMLERIYRRQNDHRSLATVLERWSKYGSDDSARLAAAVRLARLYAGPLADLEAAAAAYERALSIAPANSESKQALVEYYSSIESWDRLVAVYERDCQGAEGRERVGDWLQIAMLHYKKRQDFADAAIWFERIRQVEPANAATLEFFRDFSKRSGDEALLLKALQAAQRALAEGPEKQAITREIAELAEGQEDAQKAIEQYKVLLRQDPHNVSATESLKGLYRKTHGYNQLVDILRHELERIPESDRARRLAALREVAGIYREHVPNETSLVSALNQILQLDETDVASVRELIRLYEKLGRWRDLLSNQQRLAQMSSNTEERVALLRAAARRWLEQFSNVQNATQAFEELLRLAPTDREARDTLSELYKKRRAWSALFALYQSEIESLQGAPRLAVMKEMASLAAERLNQVGVASALYKQILEEEPSNAAILDSLEKLAERSKDWATLADALERRLKAETDPTQQVAILQKLGAVYSEHLASAAQATETWQRILRVQPGNSRALRVLRDGYLASEDYDALNQLYAAHGDFEGLAEVLSNAADRSTSIRTKIDLSYRVASVYETQLKQPQRAFRAYERVLSADPLDTRAAAALVPLYEEDEKWARLPVLYQLLIDEASTPEAKFAYYVKLSSVALERLSDRALAIDAARKAYEMNPDSQDALLLFERVSAETGRFEALAEALEARLAQPVTAAAAAAPEAKAEGKKAKKGKKTDATPSPPAVAEVSVSPELRALALKLADIYDVRLARLVDGAAVLRRQLLLQPNDTEVGAKLEQMLRRAGDQDGLRWLCGNRVEHAQTVADKITLLREWARVEEEVFEDLERATELNRRISELDANDAPMLRDLPRLLLAQGQANEAVAYIQRHRDLAPENEKARLNEDLAEVLLYRLERYDQALQAALAAVSASTESPRAIEVLQRLVEVDATKRAAALALVEVYAEKGERRREADAILVLLGVESEPERRKALYERGVSVFEILDSFNAAFELTLRACRDFPADLSVWERAHAFAVRAGRATELADTYREILRGKLPDAVRKELCERAASLHEVQLGDPAGATPYLEQVLHADPGNAAAFSKLKQILTSNQRWGELQTLYNDSLKAVTDPAVSLELLTEVAMICEEFVEDSKAAISYYERMLEIEPNHDAALQALDRLYDKFGEDVKLAALLERRLDLALANPSAMADALELRVRLARLLLDRLHQPEPALRQIEGVLAEDITNPAGRELAERILEIGSLKGRSASLLENVYAARDEVRELVRVLEAQRQALRTSDSASLSDADVDLLERIATLKNERLKDDEGALTAFAEYIPERPSDAQARTHLLEIGRRLNANQRVASVLESAAERAKQTELKGEILMQAGDVLEHALRLPERARTLYQTVLSLAADNAELALPAAQALERIYRQSGEHAELVSVLRTQLAFQTETEARAALLARIAELCTERLGDPESAIVAWKQRLEENPGDADSLSALDALYERTGAAQQLASVLEQRAQFASAPDERRTLLGRLAEVFRDRLKDRRAAIDTYRSIAEEFGSSISTSAALSDLLSAEERWEDYSDVLLTYSGLVEGQEKLDLEARLAETRWKHLSDAEGALDVYREIIEKQPGHAAARSALSELTKGGENRVRHDAARILAPVIQVEGKHTELVEVLVTLTETSSDVEERLGFLARAADVAESILQEPARAFDLVSQGLSEGAGHVDLAPWLVKLDRLSSAAGKRREQFELLRSVLPNIFDGDVAYQVTFRMAKLALDDLGNRELALEFFQKALEAKSDSREALVALEELYKLGEDHHKLLEILERRSELEEEQSQRTRIQLWRAEVLHKKLSDTDGAIRVLEHVLDTGLDATAVSELERMYAERKRFGDLVDLYRRQIDARLKDPAELQVQIARVASVELKDYDAAFDALEAALQTDSQQAGVVSELEALLSRAERGDVRARAAEMLEPIYLARSDYDRVMRTLEVRIKDCAPSERRELLQRLAQLNEEQKEDYGAALEVVAQLLRDDISDESTIDELERLAKVGDNSKRLAAIYGDVLASNTQDDAYTVRLAVRAGELSRHHGETDLALGFFRRALAFEPDNADLFESVDSLLSTLDRSQERVSLYRETLTHRFDATDRVQLLHTLADLYHDKLSQKDQAILAYKEILELDGEDVRALDALSTLYYETERFEDLYELIQRRAEAAQSQERASAYRLALSRLCRNEIGDNARAVSQLEEIVQVDATNTAAIKELEELRADPQLKARVVGILRPLYEEADDWKRLIKLNEDRFQLSEHLGDRIAVLRETADLWARRGKDAGRALQVLAAAVQLDPEDGDLRIEFEQLVKETGAWTRLVEVYSAVLNKHANLSGARDLWLRLAQAHDGPLDDPRAALQAYERVFTLDPVDPEPIERMEALATLLSDWQTLDRVLVAKAEIVLSDDERAALWRRVGEGRRDLLGRPDAAMDAYEQALDVEPDNAFTLDCLIELNEAENRGQRLLDLYQRRVELADPSDATLSYELLLKASDVANQQFNDRSKAIELLERALEFHPDDAVGLEKLGQLFREEKHWSRLLDNLGQRAAIALEAGRRTQLRREMGDLLAGELGDFDEALRAYEQVIEEVPSDKLAQAAVRRIGEVHEEHRQQVAAILIPALVSSGQHAEHAEILEMRLGVESDPISRAATLRAKAEVYLARLGAPKEAVRSLLRAVVEVPEDSVLHTEIEQLCRAHGGFSEYADVLAERAQTTFDAEVARDLLTRLGKIAETELHDVPRAIDAFARAIEQVGDQPDLLLCLDRLYVQTENWQQLAEVVERRTLLVDTDEQRAELHTRLASLQIDRFNEPGQGLASLRAALEQNPHYDAAILRLEQLTSRADLFDEAADILESVYRARNATDRLAALFEKRITNADGAAPRLEMRKALARVLEDELRDTLGAQRVLQLGFADDLTDQDLLNEIARLAHLTQDWSSAAAALLNALEQEPTLGHELGRELWTQLSDWYANKLDEVDRAESALQHALKYEPTNDETLQFLASIQQAPGKERARVETLRQRGRIQFDSHERETLYRQAVALAQQLADDKLSEGVLREMLGFEESNAWALLELCTLRERLQDDAETFALLLRLADVAEDGEQASAYRHRAAEKARSALKDAPKAVELYERLLEDDPLDRKAAEALRTLYAGTEQYPALAKLLERQIEIEDSTAAQSALRLELAQLERERFKNPTAAIEHLRAILYDDPTHREAVLTLSRLYEESGQDEELATLLDEQVAAAAQRGDQALELRLQLRLAEIYETRLNDPGRAKDAHLAILSRDPDNGLALAALARLSRADGDTDGTIAYLERLVEICSGPDRVATATELAATYEQQGNTALAIRAIERAVATEPAPVLREKLRTLYAADSNWTRLAAMMAEDAGLATDVNTEVQLLRDAAIMLTTHQQAPELAIELLERATRKRPDDRAILLQLCETYEAAGRTELAISALERVVESYAGKRSRELADIHRRLADAYRAAGNVERAIAELEKAFRIEPGNIHVLKALGELALSAGDAKRAQQMFRALLLQKLDGPTPISKAEVFYYLGLVHERLEERPKAIQMLERAIQTDASLSRAHELLDQLKNG